MRLTIQKDLLLEKLINASHFTSSRLGVSEKLQFILIVGDGEKIHIYSTNLNSFYHSFLPYKEEYKFKFVFEPKKAIEFLTLLSPGDIDIEIGSSSLSFTQGKTLGTFSCVSQDEFPLPPLINEDEREMETGFFLTKMPLVLFSTSKDESRPALNGVNIVDLDGDLGIVSTDGFRLSLLKQHKEGGLPPMLVPSGFLEEIIKVMKDVKKVYYSFSHKEKVMKIKVGDEEFFTRLIDGEFPPFERVIPTEKKTTVVLDREELLNKLKLISIFARDASNIVVCEFTKNGLIMHPKTEKGKEGVTQLDITLEGEEQNVAFNLRFIIEFLNVIGGKKTEIELLRPDAPVVFKEEGKKDFVHIIMPVRIQS